MPREIKFRGRRLDNKEWIIGFYTNFKVFGHHQHHFIYDKHNVAYAVDPKTVGQYTGAKDVENNDIFDGDRLFAPGNLDDDLQYVGTVVWDHDDNRWEVTNLYGRYEWIPEGCIVLGSIHENPNLLKED